MLTKKKRFSGRKKNELFSRNKIPILFTLSLMCIAVTSIMAQITARRNGNKHSGQVSAESFTANNPAREMIFAGGRLLASEEGYSLSPGYQSFAGNGGTGTISVTAPSGAGWTPTSSQSWITFSSYTGSGSGTINYSVSVNTGSAIRSGYITVSNQAFWIYQGFNFTDVASGYVFYNEIGKLSSRGVTLGCDANGPRFCPDDPVNQGQMAAFVIRALGMTSPPQPTSQRFPDVDSSNQFYAFIEQMGARGIWTGGGAWSGCPSGYYCPANAVRRDEMAAIMVRARGEFNPPIPSSQRFTDVSPPNCTQPCSPNQYYNFVDRMAVLGITLGCDANGPRFCPSDTVTRGQMAAFLVRAFSL